MKNIVSKADKYCFACTDGGTLFICDANNCNKVWHFKCAGLTEKPKEDEWFCPYHEMSIKKKRGYASTFLAPLEYGEESSSSEEEVLHTHTPPPRSTTTTTTSKTLYDSSSSEDIEPRHTTREKSLSPFLPPFPDFLEAEELQESLAKGKEFGERDCKIWEEYSACDIMNLYEEQITEIREREFINCSQLRKEGEIVEKDEARKITMALMGFDKDTLLGYDSAIKSEKELKKTKFALFLQEVAVSDGHVLNIEEAPEKYAGLAVVVVIEAMDLLKEPFVTDYNRYMVLLLCELHLFS